MKIKGLIFLFLFLIPNFSFAGVFYEDWPDAIICDVGYLQFTLYHEYVDVDGGWYGSSTAGSHIYGNVDQQVFLYFDSVGDYIGDDGMDANDCTNLSVSDLYTAGIAFDFVSESSSGGSSQIQDDLAYAQIGFYGLILFFISFILSIWIWKSFMQ